MASSTVTVEALAARLTTDIAETLGPRLRCVAAHGSWVSGDFCPGRSDLDLLVVLGRDPTEADLTALQRVHAEIEDDHPDWTGHVEVGYVGVDAIRDVVAGAIHDHQLLRISPGEALHRVPATRHYVLDWDATRRADRALRGSSPREVVPAIPGSLVREVLHDHLRSWPEWLLEATHTGFRAYAVLTVARCRARLDTGRPLSKRAAARWVVDQHPQWSSLATWAERWWYEGGADDEAPPDVTPFVTAMSDGR